VPAEESGIHIVGPFTRLAGVNKSIHFISRYASHQARGSEGTSAWAHGGEGVWARRQKASSCRAPQGHNQIQEIFQFFEKIQSAKKFNLLGNRSSL